MRTLTYAEAICEGHEQLLASDPSVFVIGQGLWSPWYAGQSLSDLDKKFGRERIIDTPVSENAVTAAAVGAAIMGMKPIVFHPRMDFMLLAMDPLINQAANWCYMFDGQVSVPLTIRSAVNRGGQQGAQHSQSLQAFFFHVPGIKVLMPATAADAKSLLIAAVNDPNPVMYIDDRWCYDHSGHVPEQMHDGGIGKAAILREGGDLTIVAAGHATLLALDGADQLSAEGIHAEVVDLRSIKPWDRERVLESVAKTGRLVVADNAWTTGSVTAEIATCITAALWGRLKSAPVRVGIPDAPAPVSGKLEEVYYPSANTIAAAARIAVGDTPRTPWHTPSREVPGMIRA